MAVLYLSARLGNILHAASAELVGLGIGSRLVIAALVLSGEDALVVADDIILQFAHGLELHARHLGESLSSLVEGMLGRTLERVAVLVEIRAEQRDGGNLGKGVDECRAESGQDVEVAGACLDEREEAGAVDAFAASKNGIEVVEVVDDEVQRLHFSVATGIHEVDHADVVFHNVVDDVGLGKFSSRLLQRHHDGIGIQNEVFVVDHFLLFV